MRTLYLFSCICLIGLWMPSCQKDYSCENCSDTSNQLPVARAGANQVIQWPMDSILLDGSASIDPDGQLISYKWSFISGPGIPQFEDSYSIKTVLKKLVPGSYQLQLMVTDNYGAIARDTMEVMVAVSPGAIPPVAIAGIDQTLLLPADSATLDGSTSFDQDGSITTWHWIQLDGPAAANIKDVYMEHTLVTGLQEGTYHFILKITDNRGLYAEDTMQLQVLLPTTASGGFTFNLVWTCKNRCDDGDVFVTILDGFNLFADPNIPIEVSVMENNVWIPVTSYQTPLPAVAKYFYIITQRTLYVYRAPLAGASSFIGKPVLVKLRFV